MLKQISHLRSDVPDWGEETTSIATEPLPLAIATKADAIVAVPAPALPPVAGDQQARRRSGTTVASRQFCLDGQQRIDTSIAGDVDLARDLLGAQVGRGSLQSVQQQVGVPVDGNTIFLFGPGEARGRAF